MRGVTGGVIIGTANVSKLSEDDKVKAMLAAGIIGVFIAAHATFAAEMGGCMRISRFGHGRCGYSDTEKGSLNQTLAAASCLYNLL